MSAHLAIGRADAKDLPALRALLAACADDLAAQGFRNWLTKDPAAGLERDLEVREVWVARLASSVDDGVASLVASLVATWTIGVEAMYPYPDGFLADGVRRPLYLNRLAVHPEHQARGIGARCMHAAETRARELGCDGIRLEALATNPALQCFYARLGYDAVAERERAKWRFTTFVKRMGANTVVG